METTLPPSRLAVPAIILALCAGVSPAKAQDPFEIEVYRPAVAAPGEWELETHLNYVASGTRVADGTVAPTQHQAHGTLELTWGAAPGIEIAAYGLFARRPSAGIEAAGWRLRMAGAAPKSWSLPFDAGFSAELEYAKPAYDEHTTGLEFAPILGRAFGPLRIDLNPAVEWEFATATAAAEWSLEPKARIGYAVGRRVNVNVEYYANVGELDGLLPMKQQVHQFYPGVDLLLGEDLEVNAGVGFAVTPAGNQVVWKTRIEVPLVE